MSNARSQAVGTSKLKKFLAFLSGTAAVVLVGGSLVFAGVGAQKATAAEPAPNVSVGSTQTHILGEDLYVDVAIRNPEGTSAVYNLSATVLLPDTVEFIGATANTGSASMGDPVVYRAGDELPGAVSDEDSCEALGFDENEAGNCVVPEGMQLLVFENFSDLPATATSSTTLQLRPRVDRGGEEGGFEVNDEIDVVVHAYTSSDERLIPMFPGSTTVGGDDAADATSNRGTGVTKSKVNALRITKSEPSPESELLRGVHHNTTIYTLTIHHTGEGDLDDAVVVDYLPAGLEYLGSCELDDNTTDAGNGQGSAEYENSGDMVTAGISGDDHCLDEASIETVMLDAEEDAQIIADYGLVAGAVYTKVTWNVGQWIADSNDADNEDAPQQQPADLSDAGFPASTVIQYRAGIPLFENTLFDDGAPTPESRLQGANLDNNNGPSTRHGSSNADAPQAEKEADSWRNVAVAQGSWKGEVAEDFAEEHVDAVDVRVLKDVKIGENLWSHSADFKQGSIAEYRLRIHTSEYVTAELGETPTYLIDEMANGLCPVYPAGVAWAEGANFIIDGVAVTGDDEASIIAEWNSKLDEFRLDECAYAGDSDAIFTGALLKSVEFSTTTGRFSQQILLDADNDVNIAKPNGEAVITYSVRQNSSYLTIEEGENGATSSGDAVQNTVRFEATTTPIPATEEIDGAGGEYYAWDDSEATVVTRYSDISKYVLRNDPDRFGDLKGTDIWELDFDGGTVAKDPEAWVKQETQPFGVGDQVWFKISWKSAQGADVRNPVISDFLPEGVAFDPAGLPGNQWLESENLHVAASMNGERLPDTEGASQMQLGECSFDLTTRDGVLEGFQKFVGPVIVDPNNPRKLTWELGSTECFEEGDPRTSQDKFFPGGIDLDFYIRVTVTDAQAFGSVDITQNLVKYQQMNVEGDIFFLRDQAEITPDMTARLIKGIETIENPSGTTDNGVNSNVDGEQVVQDNLVTFRLDITAPAVSTTGYQVWDALPEGILAADLQGYSPTTREFSHSAELWEGTTNDGAATATAHAYDWDDPEFPEDIKDDIHTQYEDRTIVVWNVTSNVPASAPGNGDDEGIQRGVTLRYTVEVPDSAEDGDDRAAQLGQTYENTASIAQYTINNNNGEQTIVVSAPENGQAQNGGNTVETGTQGTSTPVSKRTANTGEGEVGIPADFMTDPSEVFLPTPGMSKTLIKTEVGDTGETEPGADYDLDDTNNPNGAITQGEYATFEYSVTIPAKTSVSGATLSDREHLLRGTDKVEFTIVPSLTQFLKDGVDLPVGETADFRGDAATGELRFPGIYHNNTDQPQVFSVQITGWVKDQNGTNLNDLGAYQPDLQHGDNLVNRATFAYNNPNATSGTTPIHYEYDEYKDLKYIEPEPRIAKSVSKDSELLGGENVTFTLTASNTTNRPTSFDTVVHDCVPAGLVNVTIVPENANATVSPNACAITDGEINLNGEGATLITWNVGDVDALAPQTLTYTAEIDTSTGAGVSYTNRAEITGYTLPDEIAEESTELRRGDRIHNATKTVTAIEADIEKGVRIDNAAEYEDAVSAPVGDTAQYQVEVTLHPNINYHNPTFTDTLPHGLVIIEDSVHIELTSGTDPPTELEWTYAEDGGKHTWIVDQSDLPPFSTEQRTLTFTYEVLLDGENIPSDISAITNTAGFSWSQTEDGEPVEPIEDSSTVTILNPVLNIVKKVDGEDSKTFNPHETFTYTVTITNTGNTPAHHVDVVDDVPAEVTIIGALPEEGVWTPTAGGSGGTIAWTDLGPISNQPGSNSITLTYQAKFVDSALLSVEEDNVPYDNVVAIERYTSFDEHGREYVPGQGELPSAQDDAGVTPLFPDIVPQKFVSDPVEGENYGIAHVGDRFNWSLLISNNGEGTAQNISVTDVLPKNWEYDTGSALLGGQPLADPSVTEAGDVQTLVWDEATIRAAAASSTPLAANGSFLITFDATPTEAALTDAGTGIEVHGNEHRNTLSVTATDTQNNPENADGGYTEGPSTADAYIPEADLVMTKTTVPSGAVPAGTPNVHAWNLVVTNDGPDTAEGQITVTDTTSALPDGITVTGVSGEGWTCAVPTRGTDGTTTFDCARDANESLASGASFPAIEVMIDVASDQDATTVNNTATVVPGKTFDPEDGNNEDEDELTTTTAADLAITKSISAPVSPDVVTAGESITWEITARNLGPSDSVSTTEKPITITDTVPAGVENVFATSNASWTANASDGFPAKAGDTITWTYLGERITANTVTPSVSLTGSILPSHTSQITNAVIVHPGETPDPNYVDDPSAPGYPNQNNYDEVTTTTPVVAATLTIDKVRVVPDGAGGFRLADPQSRDDDIVAGDPVYYQITVINDGPSDAIGVTVVDETPAGLTHAGHRDVVGTWTYIEGGSTSAYPDGAAGRTFGTFELGDNQAPGDGNATQFIIEYDTLETLDPTEVVHNWAEVTSDNWDPNDPGEPWDRDDDRSNSSRIVDLGVTKAHTGTGPFTPGTSVEYTIVVTNHGPSSTPGPVTIEDALPAGMAYVEGSAAITMPTGLAVPLSTEPAFSGTGDRVLEWVLVGEAELFASGAQITITYDAMIDENVREAVELENVVTVDGTEPDDDPTNNRDDDKITTGPTAATMTIVKEVQAVDGNWVPMTAKTAGTSATWRVTITNQGPSAVPVTFTDEMPVGITLTGLNGIGWDCDVNTAVCEYTANGGLHPVGSSQITITSDISSEAPPTVAPGLVNWGAITWSDGTSDDPTDRDDAAVTTDRIADLGIVKQVFNPADGEPASEAVVGEELWYTLELTNHGPSAAVGPLVVTDALPEGLNFVRLLGASASEWNVPDDAQTLREVTFTRSDASAGLAVGESTAIRILASIDPDVVAETDLTNVATIDESTLDPNNDPEDPNEYPDSSTSTVEVERKSNLVVDKRHIAAEPVDEFEVGEDVTFTISVANSGGPSNASGIVVEDTLPVGLEFDSISGAGWVLDSTTVNDNGTTTVVASFAGEVAPGASTTELQVIATVTAAIGDGPEVTNEVCITGVGAGQTNTNEDACDDDTITVVPLADLFVLKTVADDSAVAAGEPITWNITVGNEGPSDSVSSADNRITVTDTIPVGIHSVADPSQGDWTALLNGETWTGTAATGDTITWVFQGERIPANTDEFVVLQLTGTIDAAWIDGEDIANTATVAPGETRDPEDPNNEDEITVTPGNDTSLRITKTRVVDVDGEWVTAPDDTPFNAGDDITYRVTVINNGPAVARDVQVVDETPEGLVYESFADEVGEWSATTGGTSSEGADPSWVTFSLVDTQPVGADNYRSFIVTFTSDPALVDPTNVENWAEVTAENWPDGFDRDEDTAVSKRSSDLSIAKTHSVPAGGDPVVAGETVSYELVITNEGSSISDAPIVVTDTLPKGFSYIEGSGSIEPVVDGQQLTWSDITAGATLDRGATVTITYEVLVDSAVLPANDLRNVALVDGPNDENPLNDEDDDLVNVTGVADLAISKVVLTAAEDITAGETVTWRITPRNEGPSVSVSTEDRPITVTDVIPEGIISITEDPSTDDWQATTSNVGGIGQATAGDTITWTFQGTTIPVGEAPAIELTGLIDPAWIDGEEIVNIATVTPGETPDPETPNNEDRETIIPDNETSLRITKTRVLNVDGAWVTAADDAPFNAGDDISYRITVTNNGPAIARGVQVVDETPEGLAYVKVENEVGEWTDTPGGITTEGEDPTWTTFALAGTQPVDEARSFIVTYSSDPALPNPAELQNWAEVTAENWPDGHDRDDDIAESKRSSDLSIAKLHTVPIEGVAVVAGETVTYELVVTNEGSSISDAPIVVTDTLPEGFSYVEGSGSIEPTVDGQILTWSDITAGATLDRGATVTITFEVLVDSNLLPATGVENVAVVDGPNDENPENDLDRDPIDITGVADLALEKVALTDADAITAGETVTWTITPRNEGPSVSVSSAENPITVTDVIPEGISALAADPSNDDWVATTSNPGGWSEATAGDTITWVFQGTVIPLGDAPALEVTGLIDPAWVGGDITNVAEVTPGETPEPPASEDPTPNDDTSTIVPGDRTVIDIAKNRVVQVDGEWVLAGTLEPVPAVTPGETVSYRIDVVNHGPAIARNVTVVDPIPAGLSDPQITLLDGYGEWTGETATCEDGVTELAGYTSDECLTATLADPLGIGVANARSFIVTFATDPALDIEAELVNWAQARADNVPEDERPEDDDSTENRAIADLSIVKSATQESVLAGGTVDYELLVTNEGPSVARGPITITDTLPAGMSYVAESATVSVAGAEAVAIEPGITESATGDTLTWIVYAEGEQLAPNETIVVELQTVTVADRIAPDGLLNTASVSADDDTNPLNNEDTATVVVDPLVTLVVEKTAVSEFKVDESGRYLITVTNTGPTVDPGPITVTDSLPEGLTFESSDDDTVEADGNTVTWIIENGLQVGQTHEIELVVSIGKAAFPTVENTVVIDSPAEKTPESVLEDDEITPVLAADDLPSTGSNVALGFLIAGLLVLAGTGVLVLRDRRRPGAKAEVQA